MQSGYASLVIQLAYSNGKASNMGAFSFLGYGGGSAPYSQTANLGTCTSKGDAWCFSCRIDSRGRHLVLLRCINAPYRHTTVTVLHLRIR